MPRAGHVHAIDRIALDVIQCERCPRLREYCLEVARVKRAAYRDETYWGKPVPGFGDPKAWLLIVGLAPGAHGANRTGRMFTGDKSGEWLYGELHRQGLANRPDSLRANDGLKLDGVYISAAARCAPPDNKPLPVELDRCREYLAREVEALDRVKVVLALGRIGFDAFLKTRRELGRPPVAPKPEFGHGSVSRMPEGVLLLASYHPSQQNTSTGKLTAPMWRSVFTTARTLRDRL
ncbi:MAG TPA: uracil-DNA glycosylase [Candidatus Eisenbacteria bacterium]|nr:uracil-DNA glycosylase [Candidatus Eisenbacteria bacterium]